jgi:carbamoyl-phosphate synthase large subunit
MDKKSILIFGAGKLQKSIIEQAKLMGLYTIAIDPDPNAICKSIVDSFDVIDGNNYEKTFEVAKKNNIVGIVTSATDKPLLMMARIARALGLPFYSTKTAIISTDKFLMKKAFIKGNIPCANGKLISSNEEISDFCFPVIIKPRDNSGSRGVIYCSNKDEVEKTFTEVKQYTKKDSILVEEYIEGKEYSIESLHYNGKSEVIQYTEKITTPHPYNVELGHIQPANLSLDTKEKINQIISKIGVCLNFKNCASHTELIINSKGIFVIETSPRLGGDFITSDLVPLSTGINMEKQLLNIAINNVFEKSKITNNNSAVLFFDLLNKNTNINQLKFELEKKENNISSFEFYFSDLSKLPKITSSLNRHGHVIFSADYSEELLTIKKRINNEF